MVHRGLRRGTVVALTTALVASGCASVGENDAARMERLVARAVKRDPRLAGCGDLAKLDFVALRAREAAITRLSQAAVLQQEEARHLEYRGPFGGFVPPADALVVLSVAAPPTGHQQARTATSSHAWKGADGVWRLDRIDHRIDRQFPPTPPGAPLMTQEERERAERQAFAGELAAEQAVVLDRALGDVCLTIQPDHLPMDAPLLDGTTDFCRGDSGGRVVIRQGADVRVIEDACARHVGGTLISTVMYARPVSAS